MAYLSDEQLLAIGFQHLGKQVKISEKASIYNAAAISIGDFTRIDDFCIISAGAGGISLGSYIHIGCYSSLIGQGRIVMENFSGVSSRVSIFSSSDDFSGASLTNPTIPIEFKKLQIGDVILRKHALVGSGAIILPNVELAEGAVVGALSLANLNCEAFTINVGCPARKVGLRAKDLLKREQEFLQSLK